jgi:acyl dehydratase
MAERVALREGLLDLGTMNASSEAAKAYLNAVQASTELYQHLNAFPPLAVSAYALKALMERLGLPAGTLHASQELEYLRVIKVGERLHLTAHLSKPFQRGEWNFLSADVTASDTSSQPVLKAKTTVMVPVKGGEE